MAQYDTIRYGKARYDAVKFCAEYCNTSDAVNYGRVPDSEVRELRRLDLAYYRLSPHETEGHSAERFSGTESISSMLTLAWCGGKRCTL